MLYVIYGSDTKKTKDKFDLLISTLLEKKSDAVLMRLNALDWQTDKFLEMITSQALFDTKYICALNNIFESKDAKEVFLTNVKEVGESENVFILLEDGLNKPDLVKLEKYSTKIENHEEKNKLPKSSFNIFSISETFGKRKRKDLWILYQKAKLGGISDEEIFWKINWQLKSMFIAKSSKNVAESGLNPYVYDKSKGYASNYKDEEMKNMSTTLLKLFHDSRLGLADFDTGLESFILSI
jgi:hypothetical protein